MTSRKIQQKKEKEKIHPSHPATSFHVDKQDKVKSLKTSNVREEKSRFYSLPVQFDDCKGHDYNFIADKNFLDQLRCIKCKKITDGPYVSPCGHLYCKQFIDNQKRRGTTNMFLCLHPDCKNKGSLDLKNIRKDRAKHTEIDSLLVKCENVGCEEAIKLPFLRKHMRAVCSYRTLSCRHCFKIVKHNELTKHRQTDCENAGKCEFVPVGCTDEEGCSEQHTVLKTGILEEIELSVLSVKELLHRAQLELDRIEGYNKMLWWHRECNISDLGQEIKKVSQDVVVTHGSGGVREVSGSDRNVKVLISDSENSLERTLVDIVEVLKKLESSIEHHTARIKNTKEEFEEKTRKYKNRHHMINQDGLMIYPLMKYSKLRNEAVQGKNKRLLTASYRTHRRGYMFTGIVYPNGDGAGENSHISLFISMNKTEFDDMLHYPFSGVVQFSVINQATHTQEMIMRFRSDMSQSAFKRPTQDFNPSTGIPRLVSLEELKQPSDYLVDDTVFLMIRAIPDESYKVSHNIALLDERDTVDQPYDTQLVSTSSMVAPTVPNEVQRSDLTSSQPATLQMLVDD